AVMQEVDRQYRSPDIEDIASAIRQAVVDEHGVQVYAVILIRHGSILRTSSGKIQRHACRIGYLTNALPVVGLSILSSSELEPVLSDVTLDMLLAVGSEERQTLLRTYLCEEVAQLLGVEVDRVNPHLSLSFLGFDSLRGLELKSNVEDKFDVILPSGYFPMGPSIDTIVADICSRLQEPDVKPTRTPLEPAPEYVSSAPLSFGQKALWFVHQLAPDSAAYNFIFTARILSDIDVAALHRSFQQLVDRHAVLRTGFTSIDGEPQQIIHEHATVHFQILDVAHWDETTRHTHIVNETLYPFNLEQAPLLRVTLYRYSPHEYLLLMVQHHIIVDLWSLDILLQELDQLYLAEKAHKPLPLPPLSLQYTDYVRWQQKMLVSTEGEQLWTYWEQQLSDAVPTLHLPLDRPRPPIQTYHGTFFPFTLDADVTRRLKALAQEEAVSLYVCLLATFEALLYRYTGQADFLVGSPTAGGNRSRLKDVVGYFVNPVVLRALFSEDDTFLSFLQKVRQCVSDALDHQDFPFPLLVERLEQTRDPSHSPLFQVMFVFQKGHVNNREALNAFVVPTPGVQMQIGGLLCESTTREQHTSRVDLTLTMAEVGDELAASMEYNTDLFDASTIERLVACYQTLLEEIVSHSGQRIAELPLVPISMQQQFRSWNAMQSEYPQQCIHEVFESQVRVAPERRALQYGERQLTYAELNAQANQLAHYLQAQGVGAEVRVGLCMERSIEMVVTILAILKAGGAYVPLDQAYPKERLMYLLEDAQITLLLTQQHLQERLPSFAGRLICVDSEQSHIAGLPEENLRSNVSAMNLAYVMYTSGSTGVPKGVGAPHLAVIRLVNERRSIHMDEQEVFLQ
ncbi:MAG TPA: condensation domain-containing protein, partial [Ktedonobacteraceae bacterium]|nr:condensation domain-containing protein [Ktedonobacteraceae bacterium]